MAMHRAGAERPDPNPNYQPKRAGNTGPQQFPAQPQQRPQQPQAQQPPAQQLPQGVQPMHNPIPHAEQMSHYRPPYTGMQMPQPPAEPQFEGPGHQQPIPQTHRQPKKGVPTGITIGMLVLAFALGYFIHNQPDPKSLPAASASTQKSTPKVKTDDEVKTVSLPATSAPKAPKYIEMPNLVGQNAAIAKDALVDLGFDEFEDIELGTQDAGDTIVLLPANWTVTRQSHPAGSRVKVGSKIVLTCTKDQ